MELMLSHEQVSLYFVHVSLKTTTDCFHYAIGFSLKNVSEALYRPLCSPAFNFDVPILI